MTQEELKATSIGKIVREDDYIAIRVFDKYWTGVHNLDKFSHLVVLWWLTENDNEEARNHLRANPPHVPEAEESGVFATRSSHRPTPIALSIVKLLSVDEERKHLILDQIDAFDQTPVVDIKPYMPTSDRVDEAKVAKWFENLKPRYTETNF